MPGRGTASPFIRHKMGVTVEEKRRLNFPPLSESAVLTVERLRDRNDAKFTKTDLLVKREGTALAQRYEMTANKLKYALMSFGVSERNIDDWLLSLFHPAPAPERATQAALDAMTAALTQVDRAMTYRNMYQLGTHTVLPRAERKAAKAQAASAPAPCRALMVIERPAVLVLPSSPTIFIPARGAAL
jgi:hypothetical protein